MRRNRNRLGTPKFLAAGNSKEAPDLTISAEKLRSEAEDLKSRGDRIVASLLDDAADHIERLAEENGALRAAAHDVCAFDWSDNDEDAVATISWLRALIENMDKKPV